MESESEDDEGEEDALRELIGEEALRYGYLLKLRRLVLLTPF